MKVKEITSHNVRLLKEKQGITIHRIMLDTGIDWNTIRNIVCGNIEPKVTHAIILSDYFDVDLKQFLTTKLN